MQILRTVIWATITAVLVAFIAMNWEKVPVNFWPLESGYLFFEWPVGVIALVFYLLGFIPAWLYYRADRWRRDRRIAALEQTLRNVTAPPLATSTQLDAKPAEEGPAA